MPTAAARPRRTLSFSLRSSCPPPSSWTFPYASTLFPPAGQKDELPGKEVGLLHAVMLGDCIALLIPLEIVFTIFTNFSLKTGFIRFILLCLWSKLKSMSLKFEFLAHHASRAITC